MFHHSCAITELRQTCGVRLPPLFLQLFLLLGLPLTYGTRNTTRVASCCNSEQCHPNRAGVPTTEVAATAEAASERTRLPLQPLRSLSLLQTFKIRSPMRDIKELQEELMVTKGRQEKAGEEENAAEEMGKSRGNNRSLRMSLRLCIVGFVRNVDYQLLKGTIAGPLQAFLFGLLSAASLPIGAVLGLLFSPVPPRVVALCMAFGSGALVYAVATDLFGETIHRLQEARSSDAQKEVALVLLAETISGVFGALLYLGLNTFLEKQYSETQACLQSAPTRSSHQSDENEAAGNDLPAVRANATWTAVRDLSVPGLRVRQSGSFLARAFRLSLQRNSLTDSSSQMAARDRLLHARLSSGSDHALASFHHEARIASNRAKNVAISMWLGLALDAIPESMMMGFMAKQQRLTKVFVVSIFIANFPEAFSGATVLKSHKMHSWKIMLMWCLIFLGTGLLTLLGWAMMPDKVVHLSPTDKATAIITGVMEGVASGAMMAMTSTAMLPEAFHGAGNLSGLLFVSGFLVSVAIEGSGIFLSCHVSRRFAGQAEPC